LFQTLTEKPWLVGQGTIVDLRAGPAFRMPKVTLGLRIFLAVVTVVFSLLLAAYVDRMAFADWRAIPEPLLLWINTALLIAGSISLEWARSGTRQGDMDRVRVGLLAAGVFTIAFLIGQVIAWLQLTGSDYFAITNPAIGFFYLITALHGLHILGGLVAWGRTTKKMRHGSEMNAIRLSVELCAIYWHFLLLVWLVVFALLLLT